MAKFTRTAVLSSLFHPMVRTITISSLAVLAQPTWHLAPAAETANLWTRQLLKKLKSEGGEADMVIVSYDEKPGIQAIGNKYPDLMPVEGKHPTVSRDYEYIRYGTLSLLAGIIYLPE